MANKKNLTIKELKNRIAVYRIFTQIFLVLGVLIFVFLYFYQTGGNILQVVRQPVFVVIFSLPFLPAVIFSWTASKLYKELQEKLKSGS